MPHAQHLSSPPIRSSPKVTRKPVERYPQYLIGVSPVTFREVTGETPEGVQGKG